MAAIPQGKIPRKDAIRREIRAQRRERGAERTAALAESVAAQLTAAIGAFAPEAQQIAAFCSTPLEPPIELFLAQQRAANHRVLLPVPNDDGSLSWVPDAGTRAQHPSLRVPMPVGAPVADSFVLDCNLLIMPAAAVTTAGARLGWGGGFYDRMLASAPPHLLRVALVHDDEVLASLPHEPHDIPVHGVVTPSTWFLTDFGKRTN